MFCRVSIALLHVAALLTTPVGAAFAAPPEGLLPVVSGKGYRGVIFPRPPFAPGAFGGGGSWQPEPSDVAALERLLKPALESALSDPGRITGPHPYWSTLTAAQRQSLKASWAKDVRSVLSALGTYRRQYAGITKNNLRTILVNAFPDDPRGSTDWHSDWRSEWVNVKGGGTAYWIVEFDVPSGTFHGFRANAPR